MHEANPNSFPKKEVKPMRTNCFPTRNISPEFGEINFVTFIGNVIMIGGPVTRTVDATATYGRNSNYPRVFVLFVGVTCRQHPCPRSHLSSPYLRRGTRANDRIVFSSRVAQLHELIAFFLDNENTINL